MSPCQHSVLPDVQYQHDQPNGMNLKTIKETAVWFYPALEVKYQNSVLYNIHYNNKNRLKKLIII